MIHINNKNIILYYQYTIATGGTEPPCTNLVFYTGTVVVFLYLVIIIIIKIIKKRRR